jgi:hypothetical protein
MAKNLFCKALIAGVSLLVCATAWSKGSEKLAIQLLEASDIPRMYAEGIVASYKKDGAKKKEPEAEIKCFSDKVTAKLVLMPLAAGYSKEFSDEEMKQAVSFFESGSGKKFVRYQRVKVREFFGEPPTEKLPEFSEADLKLVDTFSDTRVGKLMLAPGSPMSATAKEILMPELKALRTRCISR